MIELGPDAAILLIGAVALVAVGWGANLSVRSAAAGPKWAMEHLATTRRLFPILLVAGLVMTAVFRPIWVGLAAIYIVATMWFLGSTLLRNLLRLQAVDGFVEIPADRRQEILKRAKRFLTGGGLVLGLVGAAALSAGPVAWVTMALGAVLVGTGVMLNPTT